MREHIFESAVLTEELECRFRANALDRFEVVAPEEDAQLDELHTHVIGCSQYLVGDQRWLTCDMFI